MVGPLWILRYIHGQLFNMQMGCELAQAQSFEGNPKHRIWTLAADMKESFGALYGSTWRSATTILARLYNPSTGRAVSSCVDRPFPCCQVNASIELKDFYCEHWRCHECTPLTGLSERVQ